MGKNTVKSKAGELDRILGAVRQAFQRGAFNEASGLLQTATQRWAKSQEAWHLFGEALLQLGNANGAFVAFRKAAGLEQSPGASRQRLAEVALRLDQWETAIQALEALLAVGSNALRYCQLGVAQQGAGRIDAATDSYENGLASALAGESPELMFTLHLNLGTCYHQRFRYADAAVQATQAEKQATHAEQLEVAQRNRVAALLEAGKVDSAIAQLGEAATLSSSHLYALNFQLPYDPAAVLSAHRAWGEAAERQAAASLGDEATGQHRAASTRLKVGFISADWRDHPARYFLPGLLRAIDRSRFCCTLFSDVREPDAVTAEMKALAERWVDSYGLDDAALAQLVKDDKIDVLVDLGGHTSERISFFAAKRAPVQVSYLGYPATTGLRTVTAYLTDRRLDPPGEADQHFVEPLLRLGEVSMTYTPPRSAPPVGPLPALKKSHLTFACFSRLQKLNEPTLSLWARAMDAAPDSRLKLVGKGFAEGAEQRRLEEIFARHGIAPQRLEWVGYLDFAAYLEAHGDVDIVLDCLPWSGHTVTLHAAWMGVPTLTLAGNHHAGRLSSAVMDLLGQNGFVAASADEFVHRANEWSKDPARLAVVRQELRARLEGSALMDHVALARRFETALDDLYRAGAQ